MNTSDLEGPRATPARAALTVGSVETEYLRTGAGRPVLILTPAIAAAVERGRIPDSLRDCRLIVPTRTTIDALAMPADGAPFAHWLRGLIDGLGLDRLTVVASLALADEVRRFAAANPGEIVEVRAQDG